MANVNLRGYDFFAIGSFLFVEENKLAPKSLQSLRKSVKKKKSFLDRFNHD